MQEAIDPLAASVLDFWLGELDGDGLAAAEKTARWWRGSEALDREIRERFLELSEQADAGALDGWRANGRGAVALILLLDQFPRNMFRGDARSFATDEAALAIARSAVDRGLDRDLRAHECAFLYIPFMHSESLCDQHLGVRLYELALERSEGRAAEALRNNLDFMRRHYEIIARFGRFPHRNSVLARESTTEEREFLKQPGSSF
jgi:uncharacterized protein (DUF924 family)